MDLRLAYRIATMRAVVGDWASGFDAQMLSQSMAMESKMIASSPKIILDNVSEYFASHPKAVWNPDEDVPNMSPPFSAFWAEWNEPQEWLIDGKSVNTEGGQVGLLVTSFEITEQNKHKKEWLDFQSLICGGFRFDDSQKERLRKGFLESRWMLVASPYGCSASNECPGRPFQYGVRIVYYIDHDGKVKEHYAAGPNAGFVAHEQFRAFVNSVSITLGLGISFLHCKNVVRTDAVDDRGHKFHRQFKVPKFTFKTLDINPMKEVLRREGRSEETGLKKALHICRGHFATYTQERPLFGRSVGTFWIPDHVRGNASEGIVEKDYAVKLPVG